MQKYTTKFKDFLYENLEDKYKDKLTSDYESLKRGILKLLDTSIENTEESVNVQNFINDYIKTPENIVLIGFVDDAEIFDFWNKYKDAIDEICIETNYFDAPPKENNIYSLYSYIIGGTKYAVLECMKHIQTDLFENK